MGEHEGGAGTVSARTSARLDPLGALRRTHACGALRADAIAPASCAASSWSRCAAWSSAAPPRR